MSKPNDRTQRPASRRRRLPPFDLSITARTGTAYVPFVRKHLRAAHEILRPPLRELSLALVGDRRMAELHEQFLGLPGPTDVLSFPLEAGRRGQVISGEVVVCVPEARRQAKSRKLPVERELLLYALHGMLHLAGFDDRTDADYRRMHRTEDMVLSKLGVGKVFAADAGSAQAPAGTAGREPVRRHRKGAR